MRTILQKTFPCRSCCNVLVVPCYLQLEAFKLKEALAGGKLKGELKAIAEKLDEEDNPVLMVVEFKK